jgi:hypothetical protein
MAVLRTLIAVGMVAAGLSFAIPAQASGPPVGSCPDGYTLTSAARNPGADFNGDGLICGKPLTPTDQPFGPGFSNFIDNIVQA